MRRGPQGLFFDIYTKNTTNLTCPQSGRRPFGDCRLFIFDFDNTLYVGRHYALRLVLSNLRHALRAKAERVVRRALAGVDFGSGEALRGEAMARLALAAGIADGEARRWYEGEYLPSMTEVLRRHHVARPGAVELLGRLLAAGKTVCVLSDYPNTAERLAAIGIDDVRIRPYSAEEMGALKPSPRPFTAIAQEHGVAPSEALVVGDRADTDGAGAVAAGMNALLLEGKKAPAGCGLPTMPWEEIVDNLSRAC